MKKVSSVAAKPNQKISRQKPQIAAHVAALAETMRIFQGQQEGQRDQRAHSLGLLQQRHLGKAGEARSHSNGEGERQRERVLADDEIQLYLNNCRQPWKDAQQSF